jgi:hypothetical protein
VLIDNIRRQSGSALYTETQRAWIATGVTLGRLQRSRKPPEPTTSPKKEVRRPRRRMRSSRRRGG